MAFPTDLDSFTTKQNKQDDYDASHINDLQTAIVNVETEMRTRANRIGTSFPVSGLYDGYAFYRSDENVLYIYNGATWDSQGQSLGNVIFSWSGTDSTDAEKSGTYRGADLTPDATELLAGGGMLFLAVKDEVAITVLNFRFTKISGISTISLKARLWAQDTNTEAEAVCVAKINTTLTAQAKSVGSATPTWYDGASTIDVSSLSDGTTYDGIITLNNEISTGLAFCSAVTLIAS